MTQEVHTITAPRALTSPITLIPEDFAKAEAQKNCPQSEQPYLIPEFDPETQVDLGGWWHWEDANGNVISKSFFASMNPKNILPLDVDHDNDTDYLIHYEGGYTEVSYNVTAQLQSTEIRAMANPAITRDIGYWLEDHFPRASAYQTPTEQWTYFVLEAGVFQMVTALSNYFENLPPNMEPQLAQIGTEELIGQFQGRFIQAIADEIVIAKQNNTPPENGRWILDEGFLEDEEVFQARVA